MKLNVKNLVTTAMLIAVGLILPTFFHAFPGGGPAALPMHLPVLICGMVCGPIYGAVCGFILPLLSSFTGMPPLPVAFTMAFELCTYGLVTGLLYRTFKQNIYVSLIGGMLCGRVVSGVANAILMGVMGKPYGLNTFLTASFVTGLPGIVIQLIAVPLIVVALTKAGFVNNPKLSAA